MGEDPREGLKGPGGGGLGSVPTKEEWQRRSAPDATQKRDWEKNDMAEGVFFALRSLLDNMGYWDNSWWHISRSCDTPFRKEGRAIVPPNSWDQFTIHAPRDGIILLTEIIFRFPEPIGRQHARVTMRHPRPEDVNMLETYQTVEGQAGAGPTTIYDSMLHFRMKAEDTDRISFRIENTWHAANAHVLFDVRGKLVGGGIFNEV